MSPAPRLLLVEDDRALSGLLERLLAGEGYAVTAARDGQAGLHQGLVGDWDLMVVDRGLPAIEGLDLVTRLRSRGVSVPILVLTARDTVADLVEGLDAGADDYLAKPFEVPELLARLRALRRPRGANAEALDLPRGELRIAEARVIMEDNEIDLSRREAELLATLARSPRRIFTRDELLDLVFDEAETPGSVDTYVYYLRRKLGRAVIETVHRIGYRLGRG